MKRRKKTQSKTSHRINEGITFAVSKNYSLVRRQPLKQIELSEMRDRIKDYKVL